MDLEPIFLNPTLAHEGNGSIRLIRWSAPAGQIRASSNEVTLASAVTVGQSGKYQNKPYFRIWICYILYCTILYHTILYYTILYYTILYYTILYYTILYYTILYYTILYYTILYYTMRYFTILYFSLP